MNSVRSVWINKKIVDNISSYLHRFPQVTNLTVSNANKSTKRLIATFIIDGKKRIVHFGSRGAFTYVDGAPPEVRQAYHARASKIKNARDQYTYLIPGTANSLSYWLLWN